MKKTGILLLLFFISTAVLSQNNFRNKTIMLRRFLEQQHYKPVVWNDASSVLLFNKWIDGLDAEKLFFTQQDMAALEKYKTRLDDELTGKEWSFFDTSINIYKRRLQKTDSIVKFLTAKPFDFSKAENITWPYKTFAATETEWLQRWQQYLKWRLLFYVAEKNNGSTKQPADPIAIGFAVQEAATREKIKQKEAAYIKNLLGTAETFTANLQNNFLNAVAWCYDPHTAYMSLAAKNEFDTEMSAAEYSAGLDLEENEKGDKTITYLQPGGSAWRSGKLHKGDVLVSIKANGMVKDAAEMTEPELTSYLSGASESDVELTVRTTAGEIKTAVLHKEKVSSDEGVVKSYVLRGKKNIGYINLPGFYSREEDNEQEPSYNGCANDVSKEIVKLKKDTIAGLILDLRYNGGGSMWEAMQLAGIFIDIGPVASIKEKDGKTYFLKDPNRGTIYDGPLVVLINGASASASEFVSAALQDYNRAVIVGGESYGKGTAQVVLPLDTNGINTNGSYTDFVKVTMRKFYRVNGSTAQWKGVVPDIMYADVYSAETYKERHNASALQPDENKKGTYQQLPAIPVAALAANSRLRTDTASYFKNIRNFTQWLQQYNTARTVPLQWPGYIAAYTEAKKLFSSLSNNENGKPVLIKATNNGFDWQQIRQSTQRSRDINSVYLKHIETDPEIAEAVNILADWTKK